MQESTKTSTEAVREAGKTAEAAIVKSAEQLTTLVGESTVVVCG